MLGGQPLADGGTRDGWVEFGPKKEAAGEGGFEMYDGLPGIRWKTNGGSDALAVLEKRWRAVLFRAGFCRWVKSNARGNWKACQALPPRAQLMQFA